MKKMKQLLALAVMIPLFFVGCQKSDTFETDNTTPADFGEFKNNIEYCGEPEMFDLVQYGTMVSVGEVKVGNDANGYVHVTITMDDGYYIYTNRIYAGDVLDMPYANGHFDLKCDYYNVCDQQYLNGNAQPNSLYYMLDVGDMECFTLAVLTRIGNGQGLWDQDQALTYYVSAKENNNLKTFGYYVYYCMKECETEESCETAFAKGDDATCFLGINKDQGIPLPGTPSSNFNRWGWTNQVEFTAEPWTEDKEYEFWAAAGQCDTEKGTHIGTVTVAWDGTDATVTFSTFDGYTVENTHLYIGETHVPEAKNGKFVVSPGQYPYKVPYSSSDTEVVYMEGPFAPGDYFIIAHAGDLCGEYPE